jgi:uncharacterized protein YjbI with pentapeptide repeats
MASAAAAGGGAGQEPEEAKFKKTEEAVRKLLADRNVTTADLVGLPDRTISGVFLAKLLLAAGADELPPRGVRIRNAEVAGRLDLENADVRVDVQLEQCRFTGDVILSNSVFRKGLSLRASVFAGGYVSLDGLEVTGSLNAGAVRFETLFPTPPNFHRLNVRGMALFPGAYFPTGATFSWSRVGGNLDLSGARFAPIDWAGARLGLALGNAHLGAVPALPAVYLNPRDRDPDQPPDAWFDRIDVTGDVSLQDATFGGAVDYTHARVGHNLDATKARFEDPTNAVQLGDVKVGGTIFLTGATFDGGVNLSRADVAGDLRATGARFRSKDKDVVLNGAKVGDSIFFADATFDGGADLTHADVAVNLEAQDAEFRSPDRAVSLNTAKVGKSAYFGGAAFAGPADFQYMTVGINFYLDGARFTHLERPAQFQAARVGGFLRLNEMDGRKGVFPGPLGAAAGGPAGALAQSDARVVFAGGADFTAASAAEVRAAGAEFGGRLSFAAAKVPGPMYLDRALFRGEADISTASVGDLTAADAEFGGKASFNSAKVGGSMYLTDATFRGDADFGWVEVARSLVATKARFLDPSDPDPSNRAPVNFNSAKLGAADFSGAEFHGKADFSVASIASGFAAAGARFLYRGARAAAADFGSANLGWANFSDAEFRGKADFSGASVTSGFDASRARFLGPDVAADFGSMRAKGNLYLTGAWFGGTVYMTQCDWQWVFVTGTTWPDRNGRDCYVWLDGTTYQYIKAGDSDEESHRRLIELADRSTYSADVYNNLEAYFRRQGYPDRADRVLYFHQARKREDLPWYSPKRWGSQLLRVFVAYGAHPEYALYWGLAVVAVGAMVFSPRKLESREGGRPAVQPPTKFQLAWPAAAPPAPPPGGWVRRTLGRPAAWYANWCYDPDRRYNRLLYSLSVFAPVISLEVQKDWQPRRDDRLTWGWLRVQQLLGWVIIPIGLVAFSGLAKL